MAKISWNTFAAAHPASDAYWAHVSSTMPQDFDKAGKKLPTPYGLLVEWLKSNLSGDWSSTSKRGDVLVKILNATDVKVFQARFPAVAKGVKTVASPNTIPIRYRDSDYSALAMELGYKF